MWGCLLNLQPKRAKPNKWLLEKTFFLKKNQWMSECDWQTDRQTCWGPSPLTMAGGGGDAKTGSSGLRSCPDSRGGVWSAIAPSFTPLKSSSWNERQSWWNYSSICFGLEQLKIQLKRRKLCIAKIKPTKQNMLQFLLWHLQFSIRTSAGVLIICVQTAIQILPKSKEDEALYW